MFRQLTPNDPMKIPRALGGALLGSLIVIWRLAAMGMLTATTGGGEGRVATPVPLSPGGWAMVTLAIAIGALAGFALGWRSPGRRPLIRD